MRSLLSTFAIIGLLSQACQEKAAKETKSSTSTKTGATCLNDCTGTDPGSSDGFLLCSSLRDKVTVTKVAALIDNYCDEDVMAKLRESDAVYKGSGDPAVSSDGKDIGGGKSQATIATSMLIPAKVSAYYDMLKTQIGNPDSFKEQGYEGDAGLTYKVLSGKGSTNVKFDFDRPAQDSDEEDVSYIGTSTFIELAKDQAYAIATVHNTARKTIVSLKSLAVMIKKSSSTTEVFSITDQSFQNSNNHSAALKKLERRIATEVERNYRNGEKAGEK